MSKKNFKKTNKQVGTEKEVKEFIKMMAKAGEMLGNQIAEMLSQYGSSMSGLLLSCSREWYHRSQRKWRVSLTKQLSRSKR